MPACSARVPGAPGAWVPEATPCSQVLAARCHLSLSIQGSVLEYRVSWVGHFLLKINLLLFLAALGLGCREGFSLVAGSRAAL